MRYRKWFPAVVFLVGVLAPAISSVHAQAITSFDPPGSTYTSPTSINPAGEITGAYVTSGFTRHGFVRDGRGSIISFDVPGSTGTFPASINPAGEITGAYLDSTG